MDKVSILAEKLLGIFVKSQISDVPDPALVAVDPVPALPAADPALDPENAADPPATEGTTATLQFKSKFFT